MVKRLVYPLLAVGATALLLAMPVSAATPAAAWTIHSFALPGSFSEGDSTRCMAEVGSKEPLCDAYQVTVRDAGSLAMDGSTITLTDTLPAGVTVRKVE